MPDFSDTFARLRAVLDPYAGRLERAVDRDDELSLNTTHVMKNGTPLWFGGVQIKKRYVSYHLMPVYVNPALFEELAALTAAGFEDYRAKGYA